MKPLIFIDLDGTLLNEQQVISIENINAIKWAQKRGAEVIIATGRAFFDVQHILKQTPLKLRIISANGAAIHDESGLLLNETTMEQNVGKKAIRWLHEQGFYYEVFTPRGIFSPFNSQSLLTIEIDKALRADPTIDRNLLFNAVAKQRNQQGYLPIHNIEDFLQQEIIYYNILAFTFDEMKREYGKEYFRNDERLTVVTSSSYNFELMDAKASKGFAAVALAKRLNLPLTNSLSIGDSGNDLSLFAVTKESAAMGNADSLVKHLATFITKPNSKDGVANAIYHFLKQFPKELAQCVSG